MRNNIMYYRQDNNFEYVYYQNSTQSYPTHTHAKHITIGYIMEGAVRILCEDSRNPYTTMKLADTCTGYQPSLCSGWRHCTRKPVDAPSAHEPSAGGVYHAGECFCIMPDIPHAVESVHNTTYSMISVCIAADKMPDESEDKINCLKKLKQIILSAPEDGFLIEDMARCIGISPYHMIRQFKAACGLTPHQFQIQCRVRKAQKLLEEGKSVTEAAYATGFCDQSHFDRCFRKIVRLTPNEYKQSVKRLA